MTEIALRTYNQEIKDLIDHGHFDEAIAHCQHILETFPRHIETYRLLGKAFLEQGRHGDAADVFQRVLSAIPEDWLSHVAMAIVREDESNFDMAIWHMERAYEVNPSNTTVQQEVRRLRGRRDGVEPPKLRLTRSALARMYIKGGLYGQAIAEIRSALAEDPERPDLQTLLASALFDSGSIQEAADLCSAVIQKLPYCMEANRILGLALWSSEKKADAEKLFQRLESLDPYIDVETLKKEKRIQEQLGQSITLTRLEWDQQEKTVRTKQPSWASSLGIKLDQPPGRPAIPDWLATASPATTASKPSASPLGGAVPAWLNEATNAIGTGKPGGTSHLGSGLPSSEPAVVPPAKIATGELPDWIKTQPTPPETTKPEKPSGPLPDWLSAPLISSPEPVAPTTESTLPDWIRATTPASLTPEPQQVSGIPDWLSAPSSPSVDALPPSSLPEWTKPETKTGPLEVEPGNIPDWLSSPRPTDSNIPSEPEWLKPPAVAGFAPSHLENVPDWLQEPPAAQPKPVEIIPEWMKNEAPPSRDVQKEKPLIPFGPETEIPEWMKPEPTEPPSSVPSAPPKESEVLASFATHAPAPPPSTPESSTEIGLPDWLIGATPTAPVSTAHLPSTPAAAPAVGQPSEAAAEAVPEVNLPDWLTSVAPPASIVSSPAPSASAERPAVIETSEAAAEAAPEVNLPDWLKATAPPALVKPASIPSVPATPAVVGTPAKAAAEAVPDINLPERIKAVAPATPVESSPAPPVPAEVEKPAETVPPSPIPSEGTPISEGIDLPDWLIAQLQVKPAEPVSSPGAPKSEVPLPDWLKSAPPTPATPQVVDWDQAANQPVPSTPVDATRPATGIASAAEKPATGPAEVPAWLDKSKPSGNETVARWLDRRLKTSTLSSMEENVSKPGSKPQASTTSPRPGQSSTQLPTWLDSQKPGGSDTVVRWMDKRETGSLRRVPQSSFTEAGKSAFPSAGETVAPKMEPPPVVPSVNPNMPATAPEGTFTSKKPAPPEAENFIRPGMKPARPIPPGVTPIPSPMQPEAVDKTPVSESAVPLQSTPSAEEEEEGAFVPPPEWLQKALGSAVAEVPPNPKAQTPAPEPAKTPPPISAPIGKKPASIHWEAASLEEPAPVSTTKSTPWVPIAPQPLMVEAAGRPQKKPAKKKTRKLTDIESEALIREARVYLETDLQKASEVYQKVIDNPASAEVVASDLSSYLEQDPASPQLWNLLGDACSRAGRFQDAYRAYAEALRRI